MHNIEQSKYRHGEWIGWNNKSETYVIRDIGSPLGKWVARNQDDTSAAPLFAATLQEMSVKLEGESE